MECKYIKVLNSVDLIIDFQKKYSFTFPTSFVSFIKTNNGGRPLLKNFNTEKENGKIMKTFLSFNNSDWESIWDVTSVVENQCLIPFAVDNFGNFICFDTKTCVVKFWNHESESTEFIAKSFDDFIEKLY